MNTPEQEQVHREFVEAMARILRERKNHRIMVLVYGQSDPTALPGMELYSNFLDDAGVFGILDIAKLESARGYEARVGSRSSTIASSNIGDALDQHEQSINPDKRKMN